MIFHVDCTSLSQAKDLHSTLAQLLDFPQWYGNNLDALYDCLTELPSPVMLHLTHWDTAKPWASGFENVLADAQDANPSLTVIFD